MALQFNRPIIKIKKTISNTAKVVKNARTSSAQFTKVRTPSTQLTKANIAFLRSLKVL